eukprot:139840-Rhodomonas_salina.1
MQCCSLPWLMLCTWASVCGCHAGMHLEQSACCQQHLSTISPLGWFSYCVASHAGARGWAVGKKKGELGRNFPVPPNPTTAMLLAGRAASTTAVAKKASAPPCANPTRSLEHLQQIRFSTQLSYSLCALAPAATAAVEARTEQDSIVRAWTVEKDDSKLNTVNHSVNLSTCIARRTATDGFLLQEAM